MGVLFDYFAAESDEQAATVIDRFGGPGGSPTDPTKQPVRRGFLRRRPAAAPAPPTPLDTVHGKGIEAVVQLGTLGALLTGRPYDDIVSDPRAGEVLASISDGETMVVTLPDSLLVALAAAGQGRLAAVAVPWAQTEEFQGQGDPAELGAWLWDLARLARRAAEQDHRLYCWICT